MLQLSLLVCVQWKIKVPMCRSERQPGERIICCQAVTRATHLIFFSSAITDILTAPSLFFYWPMHQLSSCECIKEEAFFNSKHVGKAAVWLVTLTPALLYWECDGEAACVHTATPKPKQLKPNSTIIILYTHALPSVEILLCKTLNVFVIMTTQIPHIYFTTSLIFLLNRPRTRGNSHSFFHLTITLKASHHTEVVKSVTVLQVKLPSSTLARSVADPK